MYFISLCFVHDNICENGKAQKNKRRKVFFIILFNLCGNTDKYIDVNT